MDELQLIEDDVEGACAIALHGELDLRTAPELCARLEAHRGEHVLVDLTALGFCDSSGLRALICEAREAQIAGGGLMVIAPEHGPVRRLLQVTGLEELFGVHADVQRALASV